MTESIWGLPVVRKEFEPKMANAAENMIFGMNPVIVSEHMPKMKVDSIITRTFRDGRKKRYIIPNAREVNVAIMLGDGAIVVGNNFDFEFDKQKIASIKL